MRKSSVRFKTLKSVSQLVFAFRFHFDFRDVVRAKGRGSAYFGQLKPIEAAAFHLTSIVWDLMDWSAAHRKLHDGRPAVIDTYLIEHAHEIRACLFALEEGLDSFRSLCSVHQPFDAIFDRAQLALHDLWQLDLLEDEQHEISRAKPVMVTPQPEKAELLTVLDQLTIAEKDEIIVQLQAIVLSLGIGQRQDDATPDTAGLVDALGDALRVGEL